MCCIESFSALFLGIIPYDLTILFDEKNEGSHDACEKFSRSHEKNHQRNNGYTYVYHYTAIQCSKKWSKSTQTGNDIGYDFTKGT